MNRYHDENCSVCNTAVRIIEENAPILGGKEREEANCPVCGNVVYSAIINGYFSVTVSSIEDTKEPYKSQWIKKQAKE